MRQWIAVVYDGNESEAVLVTDSKDDWQPDDDALPYIIEALVIPHTQTKMCDVTAIFGPLPRGVQIPALSLPGEGLDFSVSGIHGASYRKIEIPR